MTKKHFIRAAAIVDAIRSGHWAMIPPSWADPNSVSFGIEATPDYDRAVHTAEVFILLACEFNPRFDTNRFLIACGLADAPAKAKRGKR